MCPLVGCPSGLAVRVVPQPAEPFRVAVAAPGADSLRTARCRGAGACPALLVFEGFMPARVVVRVTAASGRAAVVEAAPAYRPRHPNGPDCPAACRAAVVVVPWPATR